MLNFAKHKDSARTAGWVVASHLVIAPLYMMAGPVALPNTMVDGDTAVAQQVNDNFDALATAVRGLHLYAAFISDTSEVSANTNAPTVTAELGGDWIQGVTNADLGQYLVTFTPGVFSATPVCTANAVQDADNFIGMYNPSAAGVDLYRYDENNTSVRPQDGSTMLICYGAP